MKTGVATQTIASVKHAADSRKPQSQDFELIILTSHGIHKEAIEVAAAKCQQERKHGQRTTYAITSSTR